MTSAPTWLRGELPSPELRAQMIGSGFLTGQLDHVELPPVAEGSGLREICFFEASATGIQLALDDVDLTAAYSTFEDCTFTQRSDDGVQSRGGITGRGSFGVAPTRYRGCTFERVRFKVLGGFSLGKGTFENCTFRDCRWEGSLVHRAHLVDNVFEGRISGCVWFGRSGSAEGPANVIQGNDFTRARFTSNVGWRGDFPLADQHWPDDYRPEG